MIRRPPRSPLFPYPPLSRSVRGRPTPRPFPVLRHAEAMLRYGIDRPDLRVDLELADFTACFAGTGFRVFAEALAAGNPIREHRSEEHTSELQSRSDLVCRLL